MAIVATDFPSGDTAAAGAYREAGLGSRRVYANREALEHLETALAAAVQRGVTVRALIAHTNRGGVGRLRKFEQHMLEAGVTAHRPYLPACERAA